MICPICHEPVQARCIAAYLASALIVLTVVAVLMHATAQVLR